MPLQHAGPRVLPTSYARAQRVEEGLAEVTRHEAVDERVEAGVGVGHEVEGLPQRLEVAVVEVVHQVKGGQHVGHQDGSPAQHEDSDHRHQHLDHLR